MTITKTQDGRHGVAISKNDGRFIADAMLLDNMTYEGPSFWFRIGSYATIANAQKAAAKKPAPNPLSLRVRSPSTGSTLITSAPRSARIMPHDGPRIVCVSSTTRTPLRGGAMEEVMIFHSVGEDLRPSASLVSDVYYGNIHRDRFHSDRGI